MTHRSAARIGVLVPFTNTNLEADLRIMTPPQIAIHVTRMGGYDADEIPDEAQMAGLGAANMDAPLQLLEGVRPDVILYGCTSATLSHGPSFDRDLAQRIRSRSAARTVTAAGALVHAARRLGISRVGFASPYVPALNDRAIGFLADEGITTVSRADVGARLGNDGQGALTPDQVFELGRRCDSRAAQAVVLSCTDMRAVEVIERLEQALGKPVITSNQAMMFQALEMLAVRDAPRGLGLLFERIMG